MLRIKAIRDAVVQRLKDANIDRVGQNVFSDKTGMYFPDQLPAISVYTRRNPCDDNGTNPTTYDFETDLSVETVVQGDYNDGLGNIISTADQLDFFSQQIVDTLIYECDFGGSIGEPLDGLINNILLRGIFSSGTHEGEEVVKGAVVKFIVEWNEDLPNASASPVNTFERMGFSLKTPEGENAEDLDMDDVIVMDPED